MFVVFSSLFPVFFFANFIKTDEICKLFPKKMVMPAFADITFWFLFC